MTVLLIIHGVIAVFLIGAITHHFLSVFWPRRPGQSDFVARARGVNSKGYVQTIIILYVVTFVLGSILYPTYRVFVRPPLQDLMLTYAIGLFEIKENFAAIGLALLPAYWYFWSKAPEYTTTRKALTAIYFFTIWYNFIAGHILNNVRGFA
ncbi:MAG TPA: hypothetical protein VK479_00560 [Micropepsaceae bacterium]|nr:hypothetical protein [Micropepsaceae bacterium]